jgi:hypothetical protein
MPTTDALLADQAPEQAAPIEESRKPMASGFLISLAIHMLVLFIFSLVVLVAESLEEEISTVKIAQIDPPPVQQDPPKLPRDINPMETPLDIESDTVSDKPSPLSQLDAPISDDVSQREEDHPSDSPKGREEAVGDSEMGGQGAFMAIGAGGGSAGMFGNRSGGGKKRAIIKGGGSKGSESAVDAALRWFKKHQNPDGMWDMVGYPANCTDAGAKCEPGEVCFMGVKDDGDVSATGYALLCFLGAGYDHRLPSKYKTTVKKAVDYLIKAQKPDGRWGSRNYEQGIVAMALAEAYAMTNDPSLKDPAQNGVDVIVKCQTPDKAGGYGLGWDYTTPNTRNDASVSGWCVMALKSAVAGGLSVGNAMDGAKVYLRRAWEACNPDFKKLVDPYKDESTFPYSWNCATDEIVVDRGNKSEHDMAPVGALCSVFLGHKSGDIMLETLCNYIVNHQFPNAYPACNTYYMYYNTLAIFQAGGDRWAKWNKSVRDLLVNAQRKSNDCFDGSWDFAGGWFPKNKIGRLFSTAYCCLSLEVYYRYDVQGGNREHK